jgi:hypothetical protein
MHGNQAASPVASGDYEGAGCCVLVRARACAPTRVLRSWPVVESGSVPGRPKNLGQDGWRPALSHLSFSAAYSSGAVPRAPPCHRVVTEQPLSPTNKRLTIPVVRVRYWWTGQFRRQPVQRPGAFGRGPRGDASAIPRCCMRPRLGAAGRLPTLPLRLVAGSASINHEALPPSRYRGATRDANSRNGGSGTRCGRSSTVDPSW